MKFPVVGEASSFGIGFGVGYDSIVDMGEVQSQNGHRHRLQLAIVMVSSFKRYLNCDWLNVLM